MGARRTLLATGTLLAPGFVTQSDLADALDAVSLQPGSQGDPGPAGAETIIFGDPLSTDDVVAGTTYDPYVPGADRIILDANAWLRGVSGSSRVVADLQVDIGGGYTTIFASSPSDQRLMIPAGSRVGDLSLPAITALPGMSALRAVVAEAPTAARALSWEGAAVAGDALSTFQSSQNIPIPSGYASGDLLTAVFWGAATSVAWPIGWTPVGAPLPFGSTTGPMWLYVATKLASASESITQPVSYASSISVMLTLCTPGGVLLTPTAAVVNTGAQASSTVTPSGITTPVANCLLVHIAASRTNSGLVPGPMAFGGGVATDIQATTARTGANTNFAIATGHETQALAGAVTPRSVTFPGVSPNSGASRSVTTTLVFEASGGSVAKGLLVAVRVLRP